MEVGEDRAPEDRNIVVSRFTHLGLLRWLTYASVMGDRTMTLSKACGVYDKWLEDPRVKFYPELRNLDAAFRKMTEPFAAQPTTKAVGDCFLLVYAKEVQAGWSPSTRGSTGWPANTATALSFPRDKSAKLSYRGCNPSESPQYCAKFAETVRSDNDLLFPGRGGQPIGARWFAKNWFKPTLRKAGLSGFTIHDLRHTFGRLLLDAGAPLAYVSEQMGQASLLRCRLRQNVLNKGLVSLLVHASS